MDHFLLISIKKGVREERGKNHFTVDKSPNDALKLNLNLEINKKPFEEPLVLKLSYVNGDIDKLKLYSYETGSKITVSLNPKEVSDKSYLFSTWHKMVDEVEIGYQQDGLWVPVIRDFKGLPKKQCVVHLLSYKHCNTHFQLTGSGSLNRFLPQVKLPAIVVMNISLEITFGEITHRYKLISTGSEYIIEQPRFIDGPQTTSDSFEFSINVVDEDTREKVWFSYPTIFYVNKGRSFMQIELNCNNKRQPGKPNPILYISNGSEDVRLVELINAGPKIKVLQIGAFKNETYSIQYGTELDNLIANKLTFQAEIGPNKIPMNLKGGDSFTINVVKLVIESGYFFFINNLFQTEHFTLTVPSKNKCETVESSQELKSKYIAGTRFATARGNFPVEDLREGFILHCDKNTKVAIKKIKKLKIDRTTLERVADSATENVYVYYEISLADEKNYKILENGIVKKLN